MELWPCTVWSTNCTEMECHKAQRNKNKVTQHFRKLNTTSGVCAAAAAVSVEFLPAASNNKTLFLSLLACFWGRRKMPFKPLFAPAAQLQNCPQVLGMANRKENGGDTRRVFALPCVKAPPSQSKNRPLFRCVSSARVGFDTKMGRHRRCRMLEWIAFHLSSQNRASERANERRKDAFPFSVMNGIFRYRVV